MKLTDGPLSQPLHRVLVPRWAFAPLSGDGAARHGGRFNRVGVQALYLSFERDTALAEYQQTSPLLPPGTICTYMARLAPLVDLRKLNAADWDPLWQEWSVDWRASWYGERTEPTSWVMGDMAIEAGHPGIVFPSQARAGGANVVVFTDFLGGDNTLEVYDPGGYLPPGPDGWPP